MSKILNIYTGKLIMRKTKTPVERIKILRASDSFEVLLKFWDVETIEVQEHFHVLYLNRSNVVVGHALLSIGGVSGTVADAKLIFAMALKFLSSGVILAHNHPSGNLKFSEADIRLTKQVREFGELIGICVLDHLIITTDGYLSMVEESISF